MWLEVKMFIVVVHTYIIISPQHCNGSQEFPTHSQISQSIRSIPSPQGLHWFVMFLMQMYKIMYTKHEGYNSNNSKVIAY